MRMTIVITFLVAIATMACGPSATTTESDPESSSQPAEESGPALLLSEESAISILQVYLQECALGWDSAYEDQISSARGRAMSAFRFSEDMDRIRTRGPRAPSPTLTPLPPEAYQLPPSAQEKKSWLIALATGTSEDFAWSASFHGVTEVPNWPNTKAETWVVIGPGLERAGSELVVPGRWKVFAGHRRAHYLDAPARLAAAEYHRFPTCNP